MECTSIDGADRFEWGYEKTSNLGQWNGKAVQPVGRDPFIQIIYDNSVCLVNYYSSNDPSHNELNDSSRGVESKSDSSHESRNDHDNSAGNQPSSTPNKKPSNEPQNKLSVSAGADTNGNKGLSLDVSRKQDITNDAGEKVGDLSVGVGAGINDKGDGRIELKVEVNF